MRHPTENVIKTVEYISLRIEGRVQDLGLKIVTLIVVAEFANLVKFVKER